MWNRAVVGGPAVRLMPGYFSGMDFVMVNIQNSSQSVLQRVNLLATKTTVGCVNACSFCAVPKIEGKFRELEDWPDLPIICDNNLLAASTTHFDRVMDRLEKHDNVDFNQGLDSRLLQPYHAERLARLRNPRIRLALDFSGYHTRSKFERAFLVLRAAGCAKKTISSYALIGFDSDPSEAWERCEWIEKHGINVNPMWFHELDAMECNTITPRQAELGWTDYERRRIMQWFYQHKKAKK